MALHWEQGRERKQLSVTRHCAGPGDRDINKTNPTGLLSSEFRGNTSPYSAE